MSRLGYCYAAESADFIKFGFSDDPVSRVSNLSTSLGQPVNLLGYVSGSRRQEARLHELLHRHLSHGEWYHKTGAVRRAASLFPPRRYVPKASRDIFDQMRGGVDRNEAQRIFRLCFLPGATALKQIPEIAKDLGISNRRARAILHREARLITEKEMTAIRDLARRVRGLFDRKAA